MRPRHLIWFVTPLVLLTDCASTETPAIVSEPREGSWRMELDLRTNGDPNAVILPFLFDLRKDTGGYSMIVRNGEERIAVDDIVLQHDSMRIRMPLFDSEFSGRLINDSTLSGFWHNYLRGSDYKIPFVAHASATWRFAEAPNARIDLSGVWESHFCSGTDQGYDALGIFRCTNGRVTGTFGTETGDYRFLEGIIHGDSLMLSAFDGSHAFLFSAQLRNDSLVGRFRSGIHSQEPWFAVRNPHFHLRNPDSLTFLKEGYDMIDFHFPNLNGDIVSPRDDRFKGQVMMVQVMGSWCPNCVDETLLLDEMYDTYRDQGLEVMAVAFERYPEKDRAIASLKHFKQALNIKYEILYAGESRKEVVSAKLPFLDHVMSYPTCIFIDRNGKVRRIRTGFYGPGTGEHYENYKRNLCAFLEKMLAEPIERKKAA